MTTELFGVAGKRVLVTGGGRGIGAMIAAGFTRAGATVVICGRDGAALGATAAELSCGAVEADLSTEDGCRAVAEAVQGDGLGVLVNNAGAAVEGLDDDAWDAVFAVNVKAVSHLTRLLLPQLRAAAAPGDPARIINIGSIAGVRIGNQDNYPYAATKAALHHFSRHLARRLAPDVTVNVITPGPFATRLTAGIVDAVAKSVPMGRVGGADDIAGAAIYLASPAAAWVTGSMLTIDGGLALT